MSTVKKKKLVIHGPRAPVSHSDASRILLGDRKQTSARNKAGKSPTPQETESERKTEASSGSRRKSVTFDLSPQVFSTPQLMMPAVPASASPPSRERDEDDLSSDEGDTIAVEHKPSHSNAADDGEAEEESALSDLAHLEAEIDAEYNDAPATTKLEADKDGDVEMNHGADVEDDVDEGDIDYAEHITPEPENEDAESVISVSSTEDNKDYTNHPAGIFGMPARPWKSQSFDRHTRYAWESMYCEVLDRPMVNSWAYTEEYMKAKDREMLQYVQDYPITTWLIPKNKAEQAWFRLLERTRWRELGIPIYGNQSISELNPNPTPSMQAAMAPPNPPPMPQNGMPGQQGYGSHYPAPGYHQQAMHHPPSSMPPHQQMMHHGPGNVPNQYMPNQQVQHHPHSHMPGPPMGSMPPGMPYTMTNTTLPFHPQQQGPVIPNRHSLGGFGQDRNSKLKKATPPFPYNEVDKPPPTPPYPKKERPSEKTKANKSGKRSNRRQAEAREYPWHRDIDFKKARDEASWDMSDYDTSVLNNMASTRAQNGPFIREQDAILNVKQRKQRESRLFRKKGIMPQSSEADGADSENDDPTKADSTGAKRRKNENVGGDPYHQGEFQYATQNDAQKGLVLNKSSPNEILAAAEEGQITWDLCKEIFVTWNASKKGQTEQLVQCRFRLYDVLITRKQLATTLVLTRKAAECIVDFCPDLLWRETLLRMASEAGFGNKDIRDRFCYNGCWADKATFTKRIAGALGQKQNNSTRVKKPKVDENDNVAEDEDLPSSTKKRGRPSAASIDPKDRYADGEYDWYQQNDRDYNAYIAFFGKRTGHRNLSHVLRADKKRRMGGVDEDTVEAGPSSKRSKSETTEGQTPVAGSDGAGEDDNDEGEDEQITYEEQDDKDEDAVSIQDSDILDEMSD